MVVVGLTASELPLPTAVPPQDPLYHWNAAPVPSDPPVTDKVVPLPVQIVPGEAPADAGAVDAVFTVMVTEAQAVVLQVPSARTK